VQILEGSAEPEWMSETSLQNFRGSEIVKNNRNEVEGLFLRKNNMGVLVAVKSI